MTYKFNIIPIKFPVALAVLKKNWNTHTNFKTFLKLQESRQPDIAIKIYKKINTIESRNMSPHVWITDAKAIQLKNSLLNRWYWTIQISICRNMNFDPYVSPCTNFRLKWIIDLNVKLLKGNIGEKCLIFLIRQRFLSYKANMIHGRINC